LDFFARTATGGGVVIDCRPTARIKPRDAAAFEATARACAEVGWDYRLVSEHEAVWLANVKWLAGYRQPRHFTAGLAARLREVFERPFRWSGVLRWSAIRLPSFRLSTTFSGPITFRLTCPYASTALPWSRLGRVREPATASRRPRPLQRR
jgi:hypothetical protein